MWAQEVNWGPLEEQLRDAEPFLQALEVSLFQRFQS